MLLLEKGYGSTIALFSMTVLSYSTFGPYFMKIGSTVKMVLPTFTSKRFGLRAVNFDFKYFRRLSQLIQWYRHSKQQQKPNRTISIIFLKDPELVGCQQFEVCSEMFTPSYNNLCRSLQINIKICPH